MDKKIGRYLFHAYNLSETMKLKDVDRLFDKKVKTHPASRLVYKEGEASYFFVYPFGSVIFFNIDERRRLEVLNRLSKHARSGHEMKISEEFAVEVVSDEDVVVGYDYAVFNDLSIENIEMLALILAQSTALEYFELKADEMLDRTGRIGVELKNSGRLKNSSRNIKKFIGQCITTKQSLVGSLYLLDKPDVTWDDRVLDNLYRDASEMFEIRERYKTLDYKLKMVKENLRLIVELLQHRHANFLEWVIIVLIALEGVFLVLELFLNY